MSITESTTSAHGSGHRSAAASNTGTDVHGNTMTGDGEAVALYDAAIDRLLRFHPDAIERTGELVTTSGRTPMGHVLLAYLSLISTDTVDLEVARSAAAQLSTLDCNDRERAHGRAIEQWLAGDWHGTARALDSLLQRWPSDLLALMVGHQLDFFLGHRTNLRDRVGRSMGALDPSHPHAPFVSGMHAFGLEECGNYDAAEEAGMYALEVHPEDVWAVHAVAHVHEMRGDIARGIEFMTGRVSDWASDNLFTVHLWWHLALYLLEAGRTEDVLAVYDAQVHHDASDGVPIEMLDASALPWRLLLDGEPDGGRFATLADAWTTRTEGEPWYVFNDAHAVMALCGAGRLDDARAVAGRLDSWLASASTHTANSSTHDRPSNRRATAEVGLPAVRSLIAYSEGRHDDVVDDLLPIRGRLRVFGGSNAQRDVFERTLVDSAIRSGQHDLAAALLRERLSVRASGVFAWDRSARLAGAMGRPTVEADARATRDRIRAGVAASVGSFRV